MQVQYKSGLFHRLEYGIVHVVAFDARSTVRSHSTRIALNTPDDPTCFCLANLVWRQGRAEVETHEELGRGCELAQACVILDRLVGVADRWDEVRHHVRRLDAALLDVGGDEGAHLALAKMDVRIEGRRHRDLGWTA